MGFKWDATKKCNDVDCHKNIEHKKHQAKIINDYLIKIKPNGFINQMKSYEVTIVEFHIDDNEILWSVRKRIPRIWKMCQC